MISREFGIAPLLGGRGETAEWKYSASFYGVPAEDVGPFRTNSLSELQSWDRQLAAVETEEMKLDIPEQRGGDQDEKSG